MKTVVPQLHCHHPQLIFETISERDFHVEVILGCCRPQRLPEIVFTTGSNPVPVFWDDPAWAGRLDQVSPCGPSQPDSSCDSVNGDWWLWSNAYIVLCYLTAQALPLSNLLLNKTVHWAIRCQLRCRPSLSSRKDFIPEAINYFLWKKLKLRLRKCLWNSRNWTRFINLIKLLHHLSRACI